MQIYVQIGSRQIILIGSTGSQDSVLEEIMRQGSHPIAPADFQLKSRNDTRVLLNDATIAEVMLLFCVLQLCCVFFSF